jgi:flagellin-specific chaperone FliS
MDDMRTIVGPLCNERIPTCRNLMTIVDAAETSVSQAQTEMQADNTTGAMRMLSNAEQILSALRGNMTIMAGGR